FPALGRWDWSSEVSCGIALLSLLPACGEKVPEGRMRGAFRQACQNARMRGPREPARERELRSNATPAERRLWYHLRDRRLDGRKFRRQVRIGRYIADFACADARLVVEVDGGQHV